MTNDEDKDCTPPPPGTFEAGRWARHLTNTEVIGLVDSYHLLMTAAAKWVVRKATGGSYISGRLYPLVEEAYGVIRLRYLLAARTFDPSLGFKLSTYAHRNACHEARSVVDSELRRGVHVPNYLKKDTPVAGFVDFIRENRNTTLEFISCEPCAEYDLHVSVPPDFWEQVEKRLSHIEWVVVDLHFRQGLSWAEANRAAGRSHNYHEYAMDAVSDKLAPFFRSIDFT